jgi:hypothetical protein
LWSIAVIFMRRSFFQWTWKCAARFIKRSEHRRNTLGWYSVRKVRHGITISAFFIPTITNILHITMRLIIKFEMMVK